MVRIGSRLHHVRANLHYSVTCLAFQEALLRGHVSTFPKKHALKQANANAVEVKRMDLQFDSLRRKTCIVQRRVSEAVPQLLRQNRPRSAMKEGDCAAAPLYIAALRKGQARQCPGIRKQPLVLLCSRASDHGAPKWKHRIGAARFGRCDRRMRWSEVLRAKLPARLCRGPSESMCEARSVLPPTSAKPGPRGRAAEASPEKLSTWQSTQTFV